ncbi:hypothetical protein [Desulforhopalus sp. IMCC35007]|uniref:hypothetical protein n=1 Tax=Desulforhopalus sp. IMCC35007 TaxID=2569543 RepID=UPI0010ADEEB4|nr:hypothetical protein [Desulforhopalus sp. IMCC35007]TKB06106.1 hypothetical protein FCL48_22270 [Desulforhopalus sp. IMCC35007]
MTNILKNSSELTESAKLISDLLIHISESLPYDVFHDVCPPGGQSEVVENVPLFADTFPQPPARQEKEKRDQPVAVVEDRDISDSGFMGDKLENLLAKLCQQSGFQSATVADEQGLPIGGVNTPVDLNVLAAFSSVLGGVIDKVPYFLEQHNANNISVDINYVDKAVVQKFLIGEVPFFLLIICSQDIDERAYIELFSDQITRLLKR